MVLIQFILILASLFSIAEVTELKRLGTRPRECTAQKDDYLVSIDEVFKDEAQGLFEKDQLMSMIVPGTPCFRVGTEIALEQTSGDIRSLGQAYLSRIEQMDSNDLLNNKQNHVFSKHLIEEFAKKYPGQKMNILHFKIMVKLANTTMEQKYDRLQAALSVMVTGDLITLMTKNGTTIR